MLKIGLLGGTFNPIHNAHLQLAQFAMDECALDRIYFLPSVSPPHKDNSNIISFSHRLAMVELACSSDSNFISSDLERYTSSPSYTINTIRAFNKYITDYSFELFFIIGVDAFLEIKTWNNYLKFLEQVNIIICPRKGLSYNDIEQLLLELGYFLTINNQWCHDKFMTITFLSQEPKGISSTNIRSDMNSEKSLMDSVPPVVAEYILNHKLY